MIVGIGIDIVKVSRFKDWYTKPIAQLKKIFSDQEIGYCLSNKKKATECFAARFAAKEAFYKAYSSFTTHKISLIHLCKLIEIENNQLGAPVLKVNYQQLALPENITFHVSMSHEKKYAISTVILEK